jgi:hypothetical protein
VPQPTTLSLAPLYPGTKKENKASSQLRSITLDELFEIPSVAHMFEISAVHSLREGLRAIQAALILFGDCFLN